MIWRLTGTMSDLNIGAESAFGPPGASPFAHRRAIRTQAKGGLDVGIAGRRGELVPIDTVHGRHRRTTQQEGVRVTHQQAMPSANTMLLVIVGEYGPNDAAGIDCHLCQCYPTIRRRFIISCCVERYRNNSDIDLGDCEFVLRAPGAASTILSSSPKEGHEVRSGPSIKLVEGAGQNTPVFDPRQAALKTYQEDKNGCKTTAILPEGRMSTILNLVKLAKSRPTKDQGPIRSLRQTREHELARRWSRTGLFAQVCQWRITIITFTVLRVLFSSRVLLFWLRRRDHGYTMPIMYPASPAMTPGKISIAAMTDCTTHTDTADVDYMPWLTGHFPPRGVKHYSIDMRLGKTGGPTCSYRRPGGRSRSRSPDRLASQPDARQGCAALERECTLPRRAVKAQPLSSVPLDDVWADRDAVLWYEDFARARVSVVKPPQKPQRGRRGTRSQWNDRESNTILTGASQRSTFWNDCTLIGLSSTLEAPIYPLFTIRDPRRLIGFDVFGSNTLTYESFSLHWHGLDFG
ncbi:hypothetical protein B0H11DRAFT_1915014 [Mycena galericulata]|nr:hypothetical protein B0H11DRAFT_1915014 [Mycena galericulata]